MLGGYFMRSVIRIVAASCVLAFNASALAADRPPLPDVAEDRLALKGIVPGISEDTIRASISGLQCQKTASPATGARQCSGLAQSVPEEFRTFGGTTIKLLIMFFGEDGNLGSAMTVIPSNSYTSLLVAMKERFGEPTSTEQRELQNKLGATFVNETATWLKGDDKLMLQKYGSNVNDGLLRLSSAKFESALAQTNTKSKAKDF
jgi:hypothetical protein